MDIYYAYSKYLKEKYGEKVYKLPINLPGTCPNRDGNISEGGCYFCAEVGAGFESLDNSISIKDQLLSNKEYIGKRYGVKKFIAYFQNYTGTYMTPARLHDAFKQAVIADIVCINISTRPDCISKEMLDMICLFKDKAGIDRKSVV